MEEYTLRTYDLEKRFKNQTVLNGLNLKVPKGAVYGLVGRNGAGKTTLFRLVCGLQSVTSGYFELFGVKNTCEEIAAARRRTGAVVEMPALYLNMTAEDNLKIQYRILGLPKFDGGRELLELVGLSDTGKKKAGTFSLGMKQRLGIAVALCGKPDFLILDEPLNGLDPQGIIEFRELILRLNREMGITVLISSHILAELSRISTHYGFIDGGKIVREMSAEELERICRRCVRLTVSDVKVLARVLDFMEVDYKVFSDHEAEVYAELNFTQLALTLADEGCEVSRAEERGESLESFYLSLVGT